MRTTLFLLAALLATPAMAAVHLDRLKVPDGFQVALYSDQVPDARDMAVGSKGTVFVGSSNAGEVYALTPGASAAAPPKVRVIASGLRLPSGVAFHNGDLYIGDLGTVYKLADIENHLDNPPKPAVVTDTLPNETHHGLRFIAFGPDNKLYVPVGAPCNICDPGPDHGLLLRMNADGSDRQVVARGIRNTVGFDWQPSTGHLFLTDNGRDMLGDDLPSDELNVITKMGQNFGYPYCHQGDTLDPQFGKGKSCKDYTPPVLKLGAHVAGLGVRFYDGKQFPASYRNALLVAEHGSWNRSKKSGYRVMTVRLDGSKVISYQPLITGFMRNEQAWGRPVDVQPLSNGSVLISDDMNGAIYRLSHAP